MLQEDPLLLDRIIVACISDTPLHVAAILGHTDFSRELLNRSPDLAREFNSEGSSPLHLASAKGYLDIVKELLLIDPEICFDRNQDGRTPLHVAAVKGRVEVLNELIRVKPEAIRVLTDRGETILHLCVKHNRLEALRLLVESIEKDEFLNLKDRLGNTILHLAVAKKHVETMKFLLTSAGVEVNALNVNGFTALDVLTQSPEDLKDMEIRESLECVGALRAKDLPSVKGDWVSTTKIPQTAQPPASQKISSKQQVKKPKHQQTDWLGRKKSALMVVASLIATVAFQAGLAPPGGVWQDELQTDANGNPVDKPHHVGMSVMAYEKPDIYGQFMIFNTISFLASLSIILLLVSGLPLKRRRWMWVLMVIMWLAISSSALTYFIALTNMTPEHVQRVLYDVTKFIFDGRTPLHLAAMKGRVEVLEVLLNVRTEVTRITTDHGETIMHLCVKHNRLEALKVLVEPESDGEFVNWKDDEDNTILHVAAAMKQMEIFSEILVQQQLEQQQFELVQQYQLLLSHPVVLLAPALQLYE
ncbi:hypothetical protein HHK36_032310 [Tetracentron sinense]|uniref:PGG domain-containing protein n=1 Tax=Tetracentron sinense TaxID=13715 RepID=A0A834Y9C2_TETSI|nr:hypothetical protein HHK36_032310 [Tetracentron sinense]